MRKRYNLLLIIIFSVFISIPPSLALDAGYKFSDSSKDDPDLKNTISMDFQDVNLKTVLKMFSQQSGLNFIASQNVQNRTLTVYFDNVKVEDALNYIINANNLIYEQKSGSNIFIVKESGKPAVETITKIYELKYAQLSSVPTLSTSSTTASSGTETGGTTQGTTQQAYKSGTDIVSIIQGILTENGKVIADKRSNSLIIKDVPSQFSIVEELLARLDIRTPQVMIKAEVIETTTKLVENLGINWSDGIFGIYTGPIHNTIWPMGGRFGKNNSSGEGIKTAGTVDMSSTIGKLYALLNNTDTKILARPQVLTMNNEVAKIELTSKEVARKKNETATANNVTTSGVVYEEKDTGVTLEVVPQISRDGYVTMHLKPVVTDLELSRYTDQYDSHTRSTDTTVMVKDGETVVIGGLIKTKNTHGLEKVPFLGDIPILGLMFRYKSKDDTDKELLIFITPSIVKETSYALGDISNREQEKSRHEKYEEEQREQEQLKAAKQKEIEYILDLLSSK